MKNGVSVTTNKNNRFGWKVLIGKYGYTYIYTIKTFVSVSAVALSAEIIRTRIIARRFNPFVIEARECTHVQLTVYSIILNTHVSTHYVNVCNNII